MKRLFDLVASAAGLVLLSPLLLLIAAAVKLTSRGPALYRGRRVGRHGRPFDVYKFRSMRLASAGASITRAGDPRVTPLGRFLRRYKLDELPQLLNVLKGEMSFVGPRPEDPRYVAMYDERQRHVLDLRPGITSPASLAYRSEEAQLVGEDWETLYVGKIMPAKLEIDLEYVAHAGLVTDLRLILRTIRELLRP